MGPPPATLAIVESRASVAAVTRTIRPLSRRFPHAFLHNYLNAATEPPGVFLLAKAGHRSRPRPVDPASLHRRDRSIFGGEMPMRTRISKAGIARTNRCPSVRARRAMRSLPPFPVWPVRNREPNRGHVPRCLTVAGGVASTRASTLPVAVVTPFPLSLPALSDHTDADEADDSFGHEGVARGFRRGVIGTRRKESRA